MSYNIDSLISFCTETENDDFKVEFEVLPVYNPKDFKDERKNEIYKKISNIDEHNKFIEEKISELDNEIDRLTNKADGLDYIIAVASGIICGVIDSVVVGEFDYKEAKQKIDKKVEAFVKEKGEQVRLDETLEKNIERAKKKAQDKGLPFTKDDEQNLIDKITQGVKDTTDKIDIEDKENGTFNSITRAIIKLEEHFKLPSDDIWNGTTVGINKMSHHLDDMAHHLSPMGLVAAIIGQLFRVGIFVNKDGKYFFRIAETDKEKLLEMWIPIIISGVLLWLVYMAKRYKKEEMEKIPKPFQKIITVLAATPAIISILKIASDWFGHLASDVAGSRSSAKKGNLGMGIPGLFISLLKELSSIPPLSYTGLPKVVNNLYVKNKVDLRAELAFFNEIGRQSIPIIINEVLVRTFYFVRRLVIEYKDHNGWNGIDWQQVVPFKNRTIVRMMTISSGTFTAFDVIDAAVRSALKNGAPTNPLFWKDFILRINFVGVGRFIIALGTDIGMGIKRQKLLNHKMQYNNQLINYQIAKIWYLQENVWIETEDVQQSFNELMFCAEKALYKYNEELNEICISLTKVQNLDYDKIGQKNPGLTRELNDILNWR